MRDRVTIQGDLTPAQIQTLERLAKAWGAKVSKQSKPTLGDEWCRVAKTVERFGDAETVERFRVAQELDEEQGVRWNTQVVWTLFARQLAALDFDLPHQRRATDCSASTPLDFESAKKLVARRSSVAQTAANWIEHAGPARLRSPRDEEQDPRLLNFARERSARKTCKRVADAILLRARREQASE